jgi:hypothetical protein
MHTPHELRERAARARTLANTKNYRARPGNSSAYLLNLAADFEREADLLERAGQKPKESPLP